MGSRLPFRSDLLARSQQGNVLVATALLLPVLLVVGAGLMDAGIWYLASRNIAGVTQEAAYAGYSAYDDAGNEEEAARTVFLSQNSLVGRLKSLKVNVARANQKVSVKVVATTELFLPVTSGLLGRTIVLAGKAEANKPDPVKTARESGPYETGNIVEIDEVLHD